MQHIFGQPKELPNHREPGDELKTPICERLGCEVPIFAFTHCRDVVVEVTKAGGFGVLGAVTHSPERHCHGND